MRLVGKKYYLMLLAVAFTWGIDPLVNRHLYRYYSAAALSALMTLASAVLFLFLARKSFSKKSLAMLRIALPICLINSLACVLQRIGLQYTSPARYAFFEHLSCAAVPIIMIVCFRKKPRPMQLLAAVLCLGGCLLLAGDGFLQGAFGIGDVLCILAGILLGFGIVFTARYTGGMDVRFFTAVHMSVYFLTSLILALMLHFIPSGGAPTEPLRLSLSPLPLLIVLLFGLFSVGICWLLRNEATRHLNPNAVAVLAPLSAPITAVLSVLTGYESATPTFIFACLLILTAAILTGLSGERKDGESTA